MEFPSHISEVSDIVPEPSNFTDIDSGFETEFDIFLKDLTITLFSPIFPNFELVIINTAIEPKNYICIDIIFKSAGKIHTAVYNISYLGKEIWSARFEPFLCKPQPALDSDINWIKMAFVTFEPAIYEFESRIKNYFESRGTTIDYSNIISSLNFQYS
jgi:hypothetical protein